MIPEWVDKYTGIPFLEKGRGFSGCDCWGIVYLAYMKERGIELPSYTDDYMTTADKDTIRTLIGNESLKGWVEVQKPEAFDVVILRVKGHPWHCGLMINDNFMIHTMQEINTVIDRLDSWRWKNKIIGFYRRV